MRTSLKHYIHLLFTLAIVGVLMGVIEGGTVEPNGKSLDEFPLTSGYVSGTSARRPAKSIRWKEREYEIEVGITTLMNVIRGLEESTHVWNARAALSELGNLGIQLRGHPCLEELEEAYDRVDVSQRVGILHVFKMSLDPRGIPLFYRALEQKETTRLTLEAATGLARWNVRRGIVELIKLLDSEEMLPLAGTPSVAQYALGTFRMYNIRKGWGFPDDKESAEWPPDVVPPPDVAARLKQRPTLEEIKNWFAENELRFPDWKPGDPLPAVEDGDETNR